MAITGVLWLAWQHRLAAAVPHGRCAAHWLARGSWSSLWPACGSPSRHEDLHMLSPRPEETRPRRPISCGDVGGQQRCRVVCQRSGARRVDAGIDHAGCGANAVGESLNAGSAVFAVLSSVTSPAVPGRRVTTPLRSPAALNRPGTGYDRCHDRGVHTPRPKPSEPGSLSEAFREFIPTAWAPYPPSCGRARGRRPGSVAAAGPRGAHPGERLVIPAGGFRCGPTTPTTGSVRTRPSRG